MRRKPGRRICCAGVGLGHLRKPPFYRHSKQRKILDWPPSFQTIPRDGES